MPRQKKAPVKVEVPEAKALEATPAPVEAPKPSAPRDKVEEAIARIEVPGLKVDREKFSRGGKAEKMLYSLAEQPKVRTSLPLRFKEKRGQAVAYACLNGFRLIALKGVHLDLPEQVAQLFEDMHYAETTAGDGFSVNREKSDKGITLQQALG